MGHRIIVGISDEAQAAAARAGESARAVQEYEVPAELVGAALDLDLGEEASQRGVTPEGEVVLRWGVRHDGQRMWSSGEAWQILGVRPTDAADALRLIAASVAARREALAAEARDAARRYSAGGDGSDLYRLRALPDEAPERAEVAAEQERREAKLAADLAACERDVAAYEAGGPLPSLAAHAPWDLERRRTAERDRRSTAVAMAPLVRLAALAAEHGDDSVRARIAAGEGPLGLLPEAEAREVVRMARLPLDEARGLVPYCLLTEADLPDGGEHDPDRPEPCTASYRAYAATAEEVGGLSAAEWEAVTTIRAALVAAGLPDEDARVHVAECATRRCFRHGDRGVTARRVGVRVRLDLGDGLTIEREYGAE